jgi:hypothetical protein
MSEQVEYASDELIGVELVEEGEARHSFGSEGSLRDRMKRRTDEMERQRTERFPVPGYTGVLEVEMRTLSWESNRTIMDRHARLRDPGLRDVYVAADTIIAATVGFWETDDAGHRSAVETSWLDLGRGVIDRFPEHGTPRQAILGLIKPTSRVIALWNEWGDWNLAERTTIGEELAEDFETTR